MRILHILALCTGIAGGAAIHAGEIHDAAENGDYETVRQILDENRSRIEETRNVTINSSVDARGAYKETPLHDAAMKGKENIVHLLLEHGADPNAKNRVYKTPLHITAILGHENIVRLLLEHGAGSNAQNKNYETPLHKAAWQGNENIVRLLLEYGANPNAQNHQGGRPLDEAVFCGHENIVRVLLEYGANSNEQNINCMTPLHEAAEKGKENIVCLLIKHGADLNARSIVYQVPLHKAAREGNENIVRLLLEHGVDPNAQNIDHGTPLHKAAMEAHKNIVRLLIEHGADIGKRDDNYNNPEGIANSRGYYATACILNCAESIQNGQTDAVWQYMRDNELHTEYAKMALGCGNVDTVRQILDDADRMYCSETTSIYADVLLHGEMLKVASRATHNVSAYVDELKQNSQIVGNMLYKACDHVNRNAMAPHVCQDILERYKGHIANYRNSETGNTLLHGIARMPRVASFAPDIARLVMANPRQPPRNNNKETPMMIASSNNNTSFIQILQECKALYSAQIQSERASDMYHELDNIVKSIKTNNILATSGVLSLHLLRNNNSSPLLEHNTVDSLSKNPMLDLMNIQLIHDMLKKSASRYVSNDNIWNIIEYNCGRSHRQ